MKSYFTLDRDNVVLDTIKLGEPPVSDSQFAAGSGDNTVILRMYEAIGWNGSVILKCSLPIKQAYYCNVLEDVGEVVHVEKCDEGHVLKLDVGAFGVVSVMVVV